MPIIHATARITRSIPRVVNCAMGYESFMCDFLPATVLNDVSLGFSVNLVSVKRGQAQGSGPVTFNLNSNRYQTFDFVIDSLAHHLQ